MGNPNLPPGAQPVQGGQPPQKLTREQKRALAEQKKRMEQQRMRAMELQKLVGNLQHELETSVIDPPLMYKLACNRLKLMLKADHVFAAAFETHEQIGEICLVKQQSNLPPKPPEKEEKNKPKIKRVIVDGEVIETIERPDQNKKDKDEEESNIPVPKPPPKEPFKAGQLPDLEGVFLDTTIPNIPHVGKVVQQVRETRQPLMIPDVSKYSDQQIVQFGQMWNLKSMLWLPSIVNGEVDELIIVATVNQPQGYPPNDMQYVQQALEILARSIETAPPVLPDKLKDKVIKPMTTGENVPRQIDYYSEYFDNIFDFMLGELEAEEAEELIQLQEEQANTPNKLRKVWYQIGKFLEFKDRPRLSYLFNIGMNELAEQAIEYANAKKANKPRGLVQFQEFMDRRIQREPIVDLFVEKKEEEKDEHIIVGSEIMTVASEESMDEEIYTDVIADIEKEVTKAVRGMLIFSDGRRATLINDIEQSEMLVNFVSVTAAMDFKQHIIAAMPELHDDIDGEELLSELSHQGMREISMTVSQNIAENHLYEVEEFLEMPEDWQRERIEKLAEYIHLRIMANLVPTLRSEFPTLWGVFIAERLKKKAQKAAKQRAVLVGRMVRATVSDDEDDDWDDEDDDEDEDD